MMYSDAVSKFTPFGDLYEQIVDVYTQGIDDPTQARMSARVLPQGRFVARAAMKPRAAKGAKPKAAPVLATGPDVFVRPNGERYFTRPWGEHRDVDVLVNARKITAAANRGEGGSAAYVLLYGEPGCGKTALAEAAYAGGVGGTGLVTVLGSGDTELSDFVGGFVQTPGGGFMWVDGPLLIAAERGLALLIDEIGLIDSKVLAAVYGLMDGRREITVTANPERGTVKAHPDFYIVAATNPNAPGVRLSEALLSRFTIQAEMSTDYDLAKRLGVHGTMVTCAKNLAKKRESGESSWAPQMRELLAFRDVSTAFGESFAISNLIAAAPEIDRPLVVDVLSRAFGNGLKPARI